VTWAGLNMAHETHYLQLEQENNRLRTFLHIATPFSREDSPSHTDLLAITERHLVLPGQTAGCCAKRCDTAE
jgi:hypothetical protein